MPIRGSAHVARAVLLLTLVAAAPAADHRRRVDGDDLRPSGPAVNCLPEASVRDTYVRDDRTIDFVLRSGRTYRNTLPEACPGLGFDRAFAHLAPSDRYCSTDTITVIRTGAPSLPGPTCGLGVFQPMERAQPGGRG